MLILDGGAATELQRAGISLTAPWWTTTALLSDAKRRTLRETHERFLRAGANVITANTFRCNIRALSRAGLRDAGLGWMVHAAVGVARAARNAAGTSGTLIAASVAPVEDCYRPDLVPADAELRVEHQWLATELSRAGVDLMLLETMNCEREARIALAAALATGSRAWVSFVCDGEARLLSGEPLGAAAAAVAADGASTVLVNCTAPARTERCLRVLSESCSVPIGAYPNIEDRTGVPRGTHVDAALPASLDPDQFGDLLGRWRKEYDLAVAGGCCGTTPEHLAAMSHRLTQ